MPLTRVTITGADNDVDPSDLRALSIEFPFVEWGVLFSPKRWGTPRYPSTSWVQFMAHEATLGPVALSMHVCGGFTREVLAGDDTRIKANFGGAFRRCQINGFTTDAACTMARPPLGVEAILQVRREEDLQEAARVAAALPCASLLFDPSGGRGLEPFRWPAKPFGARMGYAGGIGPDNVVDVLADIGPVDGDFLFPMLCERGPLMFKTRAGAEVEAIRSRRAGSRGRTHRYDVVALRKGLLPLCPWCGEDELYSLAIPASAEKIAGCYRCGTRPPPWADAGPDGAP